MSPEVSRAEEVIVLANLALEEELDRLELGRKPFGLDLFLGELADGGALHLFDDGFVRGGGFDGELAGQEVVAAVAVGDLDDIAAVAKLDYVFFEDDFHCCSPKFFAFTSLRNG